MKQASSMGEIRFGTLARAAEGLTQWRPLLMGFLTLLATGIVMTLAQMAMSASVILGLIVLLAAVVVMLGGSSAVGIMLMDKAKNEPVRSFAAAASAGLMCLPKFLLFGVILLLAFLAYMIVAAVVYFVCKIPVIGAILAFVAHPVLVLVAAAILITLIWVVGPLMAPALWSGLSVKAALANVLSIARNRLVEVVLMEVVLYVILGLVSVMLFAGLVPATITLTGMAMSITGSANSMMGATMGGYGGYGGMSAMSNMLSSGTSMGLIAGLGVLYCVVGALMAQVMIMGMNLVYLQARESVDPSEAEGALDGLIGDVRKKAEEAKERTMAAAERAKQAAAQKMHERAEAKAQAEADAQMSAPASAPVSAPVATPNFDNPVATGSQAPAAGVAAAGAAFAAAEQQAQAAQQAAEKAAHEAEAARQQAERQAAQQAQAASERAASEAAARAEHEQRQRAQAEADAEAIRQRVQAQTQAEAERQRAQAEAQAQADAEAARQRAEAERLKAQAQAAEAQAALHCSNCQASVSKDDMFCGECGHKLK